MYLFKESRYIIMLNTVDSSDKKSKNMFNQVRILEILYYLCTKIVLLNLRQWKYSKTFIM